MNRICFQLHIKPDRLAEYVERHAAVWPEMLREIKASGRTNYSLFLRPDGLLIGYYEVESQAESDAYLASSATAATWESEMSDLFLSINGRPDQSALQLEEVFNLDNQLDTLSCEG